MKSTFDRGRLVPVQTKSSECSLFIPGFGRIVMDNLPDLTDSKQNVWSEDQVMGRSSPIVGYNHSGSRTISLVFHFFAVRRADLIRNISYLNAIRSCAYPRKSTSANIPYLPPVICKFRFGKTLSNDGDVCIILDSYNFSPPTDVIWDEELLMPYKFDVSTSWKIVYSSNDLPFNTRIITLGR